MLGEGTGETGVDDDFVTRGFENIVLTRHARAPIAMAGATTFHCVTDGKDVRLGGGVATIRQSLQAKLVDEIHIAISPVLLCSGEHLLHGLDLLALGYET